MIKYNLKWILIEEDELDLVDTSFMDKWDEVVNDKYYGEVPWDVIPGSDTVDEPEENNPEHDEYFDDLKKHIRGRLTDYVKNNPDVTVEYLKHFNKFQKPIILPQEGHGDQMVNHYISTRFLNPHKIDNHIENSRADTWIKDFHTWLGNLNPQGYTLRLDKVIDED